MAVVHGGPKGRDFTADELAGRTIRIEGPVPPRNGSPIGHAMMVIADDEMVGNVTRLELNIEPCAIVEAKITLVDTKTGVEEVVTVRDDIQVSFSAVVEEIIDTTKPEFTANFGGFIGQPEVQ